MRLLKPLFLLMSLIAGAQAVPAVSQPVTQLPAGPYRNQETRFQVMVGPKDVACLPEGAASREILFVDAPSCQSLMNPPESFLAGLPPILMIGGKPRGDGRSVLDEAKAECQIPGEPVDPIVRKGISLQGSRCLKVKGPARVITYYFHRPASANSGTILYGFAAVQFRGSDSDTIRRVEEAIAQFDLLD